MTATAGYETVCYDIDAGALDAALEHVTTGRYGFERGVERGKLTRDDADAARARLTFTASFEDAAEVDLVVEAVPEKLELKQQVFRDLDAAAPARHDPRVEHVGVPDRPDRRGHEAARARDRLALGVTAGGDAPGRDRAHRRRRATRPCRRSSSVATACGKNPVVITDTPSGTWGFVANRVYMAMIQEANRVRRRRDRHARAGRHADGRLLPLAGRPLRHGAGRDERLGSVAAQAVRWAAGRVPRTGRLAEPALRTRPTA